ncbi:MAG: ABC transporter permease [Chloroflexi bacterium]|nr:ABC transporter permease [Chloroflexota bacterium]
MQTQALMQQPIPERSREKRSLTTSLRRLSPYLGLLLVFLFWQIVVLLEVYPEFIIPSPLSVAERFVDVVGDGRLWMHTRTTVTHMLIGFGVGSFTGIVLGYMIAKSKLLEDILSPIIVAMQSTPIVAYAPLLVIWFGSGPTSKVITSALIVFFPLLLNMVVGLRSVPEAQRELMQSMSASHWQFFKKLEFPSALPVILGGLKVSATLAVIGTVVGEFITVDAGLGYLINRARYDYDTPLVIVAIVTLALIARLMYGAISFIERRALYWRTTADK